MALTLLMLAFPAAGPEVTPVDSITTTVVGYWLSLGATGIISFVLFWLYVWPGKQAQRIRDEARSDLTAENQHLREALAKAEVQRDEAMSIAQDRIVPLLANFVAVSGGLTPLLQQIVAMQPLLLQLLNRRDP